MALGRYQLPKCLCLCRNHLNIPGGLNFKDPFIFYFNLPFDIKGLLGLLKHKRSYPEDKYRVL